MIQQVSTTKISTKSKYFTTQALVKIAMLAAIACVLQLMETPLSFAPAFIKFDLSDLPALVGAFIMGPFAGIAIELVKNLLFFLVRGTTSAMIGEFANFALGCSIVVPAGLVYRKNKTFKGAIISLIAGIISFVVAGAVLNIFVLMPLYSKIYMPAQAIIDMAQVINKNVTTLNQVVFYTLVPFNVFKGVALAFATLLLYKPLSPIFKLK